MIANNVVNHNDFVASLREHNRVLGAKKVGENIAYNYSSPQAVMPG
jgi:uncharacterized protein YkwD